jgi:steroid delta-isomerase-like uncharacterized protein
MMTSTEDRNVHRIHEHFDAYNRHDLDAWVDVVADDAVLTDHALRQNLVTKDGIRTWGEQQLAALPDDRIEDADVMAAGDWIIARVVTRGTHAGPWAGLEPTHLPVETHLCSLSRWQDGKIVEGHVYYDLYTLLVQLKQVPPLTAST